MVRSFDANPKEEFRKLILPASFPTIVSTFKLNVYMACVGGIVGKFLVVRIGFGYLIVYGFQVFNFTLVMSSLVIIAIVHCAVSVG